MISCSVIFVRTSSRLERTNPALGREDDEKYPRSKKMDDLLQEKDYPLEGFKAEDGRPLEGFQADGNSGPCTDIINDCRCICVYAQANIGIQLYFVLARNLSTVTAVAIVPIWGMKSAL